MTSPCITIIIPTRERADVLGASLRSVTSQSYENLEILVSDNAGTDRTHDVVSANPDPRIRYINTGKRVSMSHNWEFALSHVPVDDRFVMIIGDDDGLVPGAVDRIAEIIRETGARAINSSFVTFIWPNADNAGMGRLLVPMRTGYEARSTRTWLKHVVEGRAWYSELPMLYVGGAIHVSLIDAIRRRKGTFFHSCQPDIYSSIALSSVTDTYVFSHEPFAIAGHSRHSNGASWSAAGKGEPSSDAWKANQMFASEPNIPWHEDIPTLDDGSIPLSIDLLVYESCLQSKYLRKDELEISRADMLARFLARGIPDGKRMGRWLERFADRHDLNLESARRKGTALRLRLKWRRMLENALAFRDLYRLEPYFGVPMRDVYEASIVAATILRTRPGRLRSYAGTLRKRLIRPPLGSSGAASSDASPAKKTRRLRG